MARVDAAYPDLLIAIETDGYSPHAPRRQFVRDRRRQNKVVLERWVILRYTWEDLMGAPDRICAEIVQAIAQTKLGLRTY